MSIYEQPIEIKFDMPIEVKKGKYYLIKTEGYLPSDALKHIIKSLHKNTGAHFIIVQGNAEVVTI